VVAPHCFVFPRHCALRSWLIRRRGEGGRGLPDWSDLLLCHFQRKRVFEASNYRSPQHRVFSFRDVDCSGGNSGITLGRGMYLPCRGPRLRDSAEHGCTGCERAPRTFRAVVARVRLCNARCARSGVGSRRRQQRRPGLISSGCWQLLRPLPPRLRLLLPRRPPHGLRLLLPLCSLCFLIRQPSLRLHLICET